MRSYDAATLIQRVIGRASPHPDVLAPREDQLASIDPCYREDPIPTRRRNQHPPLVRVLTR
jgi:hypothetical protein